MTIFRRISYSDQKAILLSVNDSGNQFLWLATDQDSDNNCHILKTSSFDPSQIFFDIERAVDGVVEATILGSFIYLAYQDESLLGEKVSLTNPLTTTTEISKPEEVTEDPVDILDDDTNIYFLIPGSASGTNAKILKYSTTPSLVETIDLTKSGSTVTNAVSFTYDNASGDIWIVTSASPTEKVRVFQDSGGIYDFEIF